MWERKFLGGVVHDLAFEKDVNKFCWIEVLNINKDSGKQKEI